MASLGLLLALPAQAVETNAPMGSSWLGQTLDALANVAGDSVKNEAFAGLTWGRLILSGAVLLFVAVAAEVLRWILRRAARQQAAKSTQVAKSRRGQRNQYRG